MELFSKKIDGRKIVVIESDRIDAACAVEFKREILSLIDEGTEQLVLDLGHVKYIDSSGLGAIVGVFKSMGQQASFCIIGLNKAVERMFQLTRMDRVFNIHKTLDELA
jgi:anti-sigma B factor antagonist